MIPNQEPLSENYWTDLLRPVFDGRQVIVAGDTVAQMVPIARLIKSLGAQSTFMLGTQGAGSGDTPTAEDGDWLAIDAPAVSNIVAAVHTGQERLGNLPPSALAALDKYDPGCSAMVLGSFFNENPVIAGRQAFAHRRPEWLALEDKMVVDDIWDKIGVAREPIEIVDVDRTAVMAAAERIDEGYGTVWSGDAREGFSGGGEGVRWVRTAADADSALAYYGQQCDRLRVMPFLEGIPCSVHGIVFPDYVAALRPVEMIVMRRAESNRFFYGGTATYWDPAPADRDEMRSIAKRVGRTLREQVNYRGIFTVDGVVTKNGFRPTEMNPRSGAGIKPLMTGLPQVPLQLIADSLSAGLELDYRPQELESLIIAEADRQRGGGTWLAVPSVLAPIDKRPLKYGPNGWEWADGGGSDADGSPGGGDATVTIGPGPLGSFIMLTPTASSVAHGPSFAPMARDFWRFADQQFNLDIGQLETAQPVR